MKVVVAIDSFKGCLTSVEANAAARAGILAAYPDASVLEIPVSDGGEGWLDAFRAAIGGEMVNVRAYDPLLRPIDSCYLRKDDMAVIETARVIGLTLLQDEERNPLQATTYGVGQIIADAIRKGCRRFVIGLGGSATSDVGKGMLQALSEMLGEGMDVEKIPLLKTLQFTIATDVKNPLYGPDGAAHVFAMQKGATAKMIDELDRRAMAFSKQSAARCGYDKALLPGAGAAGGLGYAFMQYLHAESRSGIELLLDTIRFEEQLKGADVVVTGEGSADAQTLMGKLPQGIMNRARNCGVPTFLIAGKVVDRQQLIDSGFVGVECIHPPTIPFEEAIQKNLSIEHIRKLMGKKGFLSSYK